MNRREFLVTITYTAAGVCLSPAILVRNARGEKTRAVAYFDFAKQFAELDLVEETRNIDFGDEDARKFLINGWSDIEASHTWAVNNAAALRFYTFRPETDKRVSIICRSFHKIENQKIKVCLNDHFVTQIETSGKERKYDFNLPAKFLRKYENTLTFIFHACARPVDYGINQDERCLAVGFRNINFFSQNGDKKQEHIALTEEGTIFMPQGSAVRKFLYIEPESKLLIDTALTMKTESDRFSILLRAENGEKTIFSASSKMLPEKKEIDLREFSSRFVDFNLKYTGEVKAGHQTPAVCWNGAIQTNDKSNRNRPNLLFIVIDTLRADHCGCLGASIKTPNIDKLAQRGVLFRQAFSHIPITLPSHASMFASRYPHEINVLNNGQQLSRQFRLFGEYLKAMRFFNSGTVSLGTIDPAMNIDQGFDQYISTAPFSIKQADKINAEAETLARDLAAQPHWNAFIHYSDPHEPYHGHRAGAREVAVELNGKPAAVFDLSRQSTYTLSATLDPGQNLISVHSIHRFHLRQLKISPFLKWEVKSGPAEGRHILNAAKNGEILIHNNSGEAKAVELHIFISEFLGVQQIRQNYGREVEYVDHFLGKLFDGFERSGLLNNTLVVFTSDHGEGIGDHDEVGHVTQLYNTLVHVPLIIACPGRIKAGKQISTRIGLIDILPTIMDIYGARPPAPLRGKSLVPLINGAKEEDRAILGMTFRDEAPYNLVSLIKGDYKIIKNMNTGQVELYHMKDDPEELENIAEKNFILSNRMEKALYDSLAGSDYPLETADQVRAAPATDPDTLKMLRELGYAK